MDDMEIVERNSYFSLLKDSIVLCHAVLQEGSNMPAETKNIAEERLALTKMRVKAFCLLAPRQERKNWEELKKLMKGME